MMPVMEKLMVWPSRLKRLWQPRNPLFWLMLLFNGLSSVLGWVLHIAAPQGLWLWLLTLLALCNALAGMGLLWYLWSVSAPLEPANAGSEDRSNA